MARPIAATMTPLDWLPESPDWRDRLKALRQAPPELAWAEAVAMAGLRMDFVRTNALDQTVRALFAGVPPDGLVTRPVRLALLGSCTMAHLHGAIRVAGLRRGLWIDIYENEYGQYWQELTDPGSALHRFQPDVVLLALDAHRLAAGSWSVEEQCGRITACWRVARAAFNCPIIHQTPLPVHADLLGLNEHRMPGSAASMIARINHNLRELADAAGVDLLSVDTRAARDGLAAWHDVGMWHRAKQEIALSAAPFYGDLVGRLIAAQRGRSAKCLVLDLDNTLWGGVIGEDGMEGIVLGQGSPLGEAYSALQAYVRDLSRRGVILAVCSKNDMATAVAPFETHPDMTLKRADIASFVANWGDKAGNLRAIADALNIGLDSLVLVDDNPAERALVRRELPMVAVPEVTDDPIGMIAAIADAGYFETTAITDDDRARAAQYQARGAREALRASTTDMDGYLRGLDMALIWRRFDGVGLPRIVQLINKTNQFNLTTRRYGHQDIEAVMRCERGFGLQLRLTDRFGDNGVIAICIARMLDADDLLIDTWLMSCRVLGRGVESATLNLIAEQARRLGARRLLGDYVPTPRNAMVRDHYVRLGFALADTQADGASRAVLDLTDYRATANFITVTEG